MKVQAIAVMSVDGKLTRWGEENIYHWSSPEDFEHFKRHRDNADAIIMGRKMYDIIKPTIDLSIKPCRYVLTRNPKKYLTETIQNKVEFTDENPGQLLKRLAQKNFKKVTLVGGTQTFDLFAQKKLIDEFIITVEPLIFGKGTTLMTSKLDIDL